MISDNNILKDCCFKTNENGAYFSIQGCCVHFFFFVAPPPPMTADEFIKKLRDRISTGNNQVSISESEIEGTVENVCECYDGTVFIEGDINFDYYVFAYKAYETLKNVFGKHPPVATCIEKLEGLCCVILKQD